MEYPSPVQPIGWRPYLLKVPNSAPLVEGLLDPLLVLKNESHDQVCHQVHTGCNEAQVDEREADLFRFHVQLPRPPCTDTESVAFEIRLDTIDRRGFLSSSMPMTQDKQ